jgi:hypothetical protein
MKFRMNLYLVALLGAVFGTMSCGGGGSKTTTVLLMNEQGGGLMGCNTRGPFKIPDGATMTYDVFDTGSNMDVGIVNALDGCDLTKGHAVTSNTNWAGEVMKTTESLSGGSYQIVFNCKDLSYFCAPTIYSLSYEN